MGYSLKERSWNGFLSVSNCFMKTVITMGFLVISFIRRRWKWSRPVFWLISCSLIFWSPLWLRGEGYYGENLWFLVDGVFCTQKCATWSKRRRVDRDPMDQKHSGFFVGCLDLICEELNDFLSFFTMLFFLKNCTYKISSIK